MREQEERNDGLGRHGMKQKEENMGTEKGKKTQGHTKTHINTDIQRLTQRTETQGEPQGQGTKRKIRTRQTNLRTANEPKT